MMSGITQSVVSLWVYTLIFLSIHVSAQSSVTTSGIPYLIRQRPTLNGNGSVELYSPYFLWNNRFRNTFTPLTEPMKVYSNLGQLHIKMTVEVATISNGIFSYQTRVFCYESICSTPGPTLIVEPGDSVKIELINRLEKSFPSRKSSEFADEVFYPNRTNLFFQSLPIDPNINSPFRYTEGGGDSIFYNFRVPTTISAGTHWYHSHVHGLSALHVMGGLFGAFVIEIRDISKFPATFATIPRKLVVLSHIFIESSESVYLENIPNNHSFSLQDEDFESSSLSLSYLSKVFGSNLNLNIVYPTTIVPKINDAWLVNNQFQPTFVTSPGAWTILDIVVASGDRIVELEMRSDLPGKVNTTRECVLRLLGRNGRYFDASRSGEAVNHLILLQGDRASLAIMCPNSGTYYLQSLAHTHETDTYFHVGDWTTKSTQVILQLQTYGGFNDNSSAIASVLNNITFLKANVPESNLLKKYDVRNVRSLSRLSISTAQNSPLQFASIRQSCNNLPAVNVSQYPYNSGNTAIRSQYVVGVGRDCRNPCYDNLLCAALFGNENYSVEEFPVTLNGNCSFSAMDVLNVGRNLRNCPSSVNISKVISDVWDDTTLFSDASSITNIFPGTVAVNATNRLYQLHLFGHASFPYPIYMQNHELQYLAFENVNPTITNIVSRDDYAPLYNYDASIYGLNAADRRDILIPLEGKSSFVVEMIPEIDQSAHGNTALYPILSTYLKFSDRGFLRFVQISLNNASGEIPPSVPPTMQPTVPTTNPHDSRITVNYTQSVNVDSNGNPYLCDVTGNSSIYEEEIDIATRTRIIRMNSCPNHYSVCQNTQCGGNMKTRALQWYRELRIPLYPVMAEKPLDMTCSADMVGVAANGVGIFSPAVGGEQECKFFRNDTRSRFGRTPCVAGSRGEGLLTCGDSMQLNRRQIDKCGGYADEFYHNQYFSGLYRYTSLPTCLLNQLSGTDSSSTPSTSSGHLESTSLPRKGHSVQLGWALDGFPIYGPTGIRGILMRRCGIAGAHPQICLDNCNGYYGRLPGVDEYLYRYYLTGNHTMTDASSGPGEAAPACSRYVQISGNSAERCGRIDSPCCSATLPDLSYFPYTLGCFRGCLLSKSILKESGEYSQQSCFLASKPATTALFIPQPLASASSLYSDPDSQALYGGVATSGSVHNPTSTNESVPSSIPLEVESTGLISGDGNSGLREDRRVLYRDPFDLQVEIFSAQVLEKDAVTSDILAVKVNEQVLGGVRSTSLSSSPNDNLSSPYNAVKAVNYDKTDGTVNTITTIANADHYFTGMAMDHRCQMLYFTDQNKIFKQQLHPETAQPLHSQPTIVVAGIIKVDLFGHNLGITREDILVVSVKSTHICQSIVHITAQHVSCLLITDIASVDDPQGETLHASDVMIRTISGVTYGISLDARSQVEAATTRPILTRVHFNRLPLMPYSLSLVVDPIGDSASLSSELLTQSSGKSTLLPLAERTNRCLSGEDVTIYWTNTAPSPIGQNVQRVRGNGQQLDTIMTQVPSGRGLSSFPALLDTTDEKLAYVDHNLWSVKSSNGDKIATLRYNATCRGTGYEFLHLLSTRARLFEGDYDSNVEPSYDEIMQYQYATGVDPRVFLGSCRHRLGHVIFVTDAAQTGRLLRIHTLPIQSQVVFQPYLSYDASGLFSSEFGQYQTSFWRMFSASGSLVPDVYLSSLYFQSQPKPLSWSLTTRLLQEVAKIQSIELDFLANRVYVSTRDHGLILSMSFPVLVSAQENATTVPHLNSTVPSTAEFQSNWPVSLDVQNWQLNCVSKQRQQHRGLWPTRWLRIVHCGNSLTRAHGLFVLPIADSGLTMDSDANIFFPWILKPRIFLVDTNQQQLIVAREEGIQPIQSADLGRSFQLYFPHQIKLFRSTNILGTTTVNHKLLISEYMGRLWSIDLQSSTDGSSIDIGDHKLLPELLIDWSAFTASIKVRELITDNRSRGNASYNGIFFEASP